MVESQPSKLLVAGSIPVSRSIRLGLSASLMAGRQITSNALTLRLAQGHPERSRGVSERSESKGRVRRKVVWGS